MEKMFLKRNPLVFLLFLMLFLLGAGFFSYSFLLPRYIEKKILPELGRQLSSSLAGRVYTVGLSAAEFGDIVLGDTLHPAVSIGSVHADYSLPSLLAKELGQVRINGLALHLEVLDGRIVIPGVDLENLASAQAEEPVPQQSSELNLPIRLGNFQVSNGLVKITYAGKLFLIPFDLQLNRDPAEKTLQIYKLHLLLKPLGEEITLAGTIDLTGNKSVLTLSADSLNMSKFAVLAGGQGTNFNLGNTSFRGEVEIILQPFQLVSANLSIDPELLHFGETPVLLGHIVPDAGHAIYLELKNEGGQLLVKAEGHMSQPFSAALELHGSVSREQEGMQSFGNIVIRIAEPMRAENSDRPALVLQSFPDLHGDFILARNKSGAWKAELKSLDQKQQGSPAQHLHLHYDTISLHSGTPTFAVFGQGTVDADEVEVSLAVPDVQVRYAGAEITMPEAGVQTTYVQKEDPDRGRTSSTAFGIALGSIKFTQKGLSGKADISLQGKMAPHLTYDLKTLQAEGKVTFSNAEIIERDSAVKLADIAGNIPWFWPQRGREMTGEIKVPRIRWKDLDLGSFKADIKLKDMMYILKGGYKSSLLKGIEPKLSARAGFTDAAYYGEIALQSDMAPFAAVNLGKFDPTLNNSYFSGELGLDGSLKLKEGGFQGRMQVRLQNGVFDFPEKKYNIRGIDLSILIPALPDLRTAPAQTLHFAEASIGNLVFSNGKLVWQLESMNSVFLEEGLVQWVGGRVFTNAVRFSPDKKEFVVPLFCDRLRLTDLLHQFGISDAAGEGTVSGRLPLLIGKKTIGFEDGFLYSSPGQGGSVKVSAFDLLAAGIPKNTPQFAQVDFAAEALKNFQYNWVKLILNTEGEDLIMQMQMDGKPVQSLPFKYDSQTGLLQRIENTGQGIMQPIRLDVNFRLPVNRFLGYSGKIQDMMKKIK